MARVDRDSVAARLERMLDEVDVIQQRLPESAEQYADPAAEDLRYQLEHRLYIALQAMLDTAAHIATISGAQPLDSYADAIMATARFGVVEPELAERLARAPGLRNALVHDYLEIDHRRVHAAMRDLGQLRRFAEQVWGWVERQ